MKKLLSLILALTMVVCSFSVAFAEDVVEIGTADELIALAQTIADDENAGSGKTYKLTANIDLGNAEWSTYIGTYEKPFLGTFDGNGHIIKNYTITIPNSGSTPDFQLGIGLFGCISGDAVIKNLGVENITVGSAINSWRETAGGIVGIVAGSATVSGCYAKNLTVTDTVSPDIMSVAGIAASIVSDDAVIENCYATGMDFQLGIDCDAGIVGATIAASSIRNCYSTKTITRVHNTAAEGTGAKVTNCYYVETAPWPAEMYFGTQVTADALKGMAATLGDAFIADSDVFPSNNGYPVLAWEENTKILEGEAVIESSTPANNGKDVATNNVTVKVVFNKMLAASTVEENVTVLVDKDVDFDVVTVGEYTDEVIILFSRLDLNTTYTISFTGDIMTYAGDAVAEGQTLTFKTGVGFNNMVENADMENTTNKSVFTDKNGGNSLAFVEKTGIDGKKTNVIALSPAWNDQPVALADFTLKAGTYYVGAWVMSEEDMSISLTMSDEAQYWLTHSETLTAGEWKYVEKIFEPVKEVSQTSFRAKEQVTMYVDNWCVYDLSKSTGATTSLVGSTIENGADNVSPFAVEFELYFNGNIKPSTLDCVTISGDNELKVGYSALDMSKFTFTVDGALELGSEYTISFDGLVDIAGNIVYAPPITFTTYAEPVADTVVTSTTPAKNDTGVSRSLAEILINFDAPIDETTVSGVTVTPNIVSEIKLAEDNASQIVVVIDSSKVEFEEEYTVNVPRTVKTIPTNSGVVFNAVPYEFSFTTITEEDVAAVINAAIGDATAMEAAINGIYDELPVASKAYEFVLEELADNTEELYTTLAAIEEIEDVEDLQYALNSISVDIILNNVDDKEVVAELFTDCAGLFTEGLQTAYNDYISEDTQEAIAEKAIDMKDESYDEIKEMVVFETIKASFAETSGSTAVENLIKAVADCLTGTNSIDSLIEDADESSKSAKIYGELQNLEIIELSDIKSSLKAAIKKYEGGGGGGGGTGTGGTGTTKAPGQGSAGFIPVMPETTVTASVFNDLASVTWAKDSIEALYNKGIINGKADGVFDPDGLITRAEFAKIAVLAVGGYDANATADFADVSASDWSYSYVASAYNLGLINGIGDGLFGGNNYITREEMATILSRMAKTAGLELTKDVLFFTDEAEIADYAKEAVTLLSSNGIVNGTGNGKFEPKGNATRAQAAVIFDRFLAKSGN